MAEKETPEERPNSVEITSSAKGDLSFKVKAYADKLGDASLAARLEAKVLMEWIAGGCK